MNGHLLDWLATAVDRDATSTAWVADGERWSFAQADKVSNQVARTLLDHGCAPGDRVVVAAEKSPITLAALLGVLKAGGIYVPVDTGSPVARMTRILRAAEPSAVLVDGTSTELGEALTARPWVIGHLGTPVPDHAFTFTRRDLDAADDVAVRVDGPATAHLLFTSGSTGSPKGIPVSHESASAFVAWAVPHFGMGSHDRISGHPPLHFDLSTFDLYGALASGAELHLVPASLGADPRGLAAFIRDRRLTQWFSVPTVLSLLARFGLPDEHDFPEMRRLLWCGDVLPTPVLAQWMRRLPHVQFTNLYGPTEATIASSHHTVSLVPDDETVPVPIGEACDGEELVVLDESHQLARVDEVGDLHIGGVGLSQGYWRDDAKTADAFIADPRRPGGRLYRTGDLARRDAQGLFHFHGRVDAQIKSRGYRIELGEIEAALAAVDGLRECAVVGVELGEFEGTTIAAAYSCDEELTTARIRMELTRLIPRYMIPSKWLSLDELPRNVNGKIDRRAIGELWKTRTRG